MRTDSRSSQAFTLVELLVVVAIIIALIGILLPALSGARVSAKKAATRSLMTAVSASMSQFKADKGRMPGYFTQEALGSASNANRFGLTQMENALIELAGGIVEVTGNQAPPQGVITLVDVSNPQQPLYINPALMGSTDGPGYITLGKNVMQPITGQFNGSVGSSRRDLMPDIIDPFGTPLILWQKNPLAGASDQFAALNTQILPSGQTSSEGRSLFYWASNAGMLQTYGLGNGAKKYAQVGNSVLGKKPSGGGGGGPAGGGGGGPTFSNVPDPSPADMEASMEALLGHPDMPQQTAGGDGAGPPRPAEPLAEAVLHSAGQDSTYLENERQRLGNQNMYMRALYRWEDRPLNNTRGKPIEKFNDIVQPAG